MFNHCFLTFQQVFHTLFVSFLLADQKNGLLSINGLKSDFSINDIM